MAGFAMQTRPFGNGISTTSFTTFATFARRTPFVVKGKTDIVQPGPQRPKKKAKVRERWFPISQPLIWQGTEEQSMKESAPPQTLTPPWKVILLSDGSVTRHLKLMTNLDVIADCFEMHVIGDDEYSIPSGAKKIPGPRLRRQVFLRTPQKEGQQNSDILVYAASWWNAEDAKVCLAKEEQPIWTSLLGSELRREIQFVYHGFSRFLEEQLQVEGPFWGRQYVFYRDGGKPLTCIYEVFSPKLEKYLGQMNVAYPTVAEH